MTTPISDTNSVEPQASNVQRRSGLQAIFAAATALTGLVLAVHPTSAVVQALGRAIPQIGDALPVVLTACGTVVAALSHPPSLRKPADVSRNPERSDGPSKDSSTPEPKP
jgi:hypothetical protein